MVYDLYLFFLDRVCLFEKIDALDNVVVSVDLLFELFDSVVGQPNVQKNTAEGTDRASEKRN